MNYEKAIEELKERYELGKADYMKDIPEYVEALGMAIDALEAQKDSETKSHDEAHILKGCIELMHGMVSDFQQWYEWIHGENAVADLDEEERFWISKTYFRIVQKLFLQSTSHSGGTSTRMKCNELGVDWTEDIEFGFEVEE